MVAGSPTPKQGKRLCAREGAPLFDRSFHIPGRRVPPRLGLSRGVAPREGFKSSLGDHRNRRRNSCDRVGHQPRDK